MTLPVVSVHACEAFFASQAHPLKQWVHGRYLYKRGTNVVQVKECMIRKAKTYNLNPFKQKEKVPKSEDFRTFSLELLAGLEPATC